MPSKVMEFSYVCLLVIKCQEAPKFIWLQQQHLSVLLGVPSPPQSLSFCSHSLVLAVFFPLCVFKFSGSALTVLTSAALENMCLSSAAVQSSCRGMKNLARLKQTIFPSGNDVQQPWVPLSHCEFTLETTFALEFAEQPLGCQATPLQLSLCFVFFSKGI